ncbi:hypothetical protein [Fluviispira sanaruensis]|uniref:Uncharacterized protein n=1 Tax=Fluviispira sanaruensis TaxID=2493639 RepID=A0A4P2VP01_FLUSA|nr:hypothetical protein [Fluviispira sanaruensis]BBH54688.1 hypothetical protein JCM31447_31620 [Fluviispira sanaruensis]
MPKKNTQAQTNLSESQLKKESVKAQSSVYSLTNATTISLMMREANRSANIDTKIIENTLKQGRFR